VIKNFEMLFLLHGSSSPAPGKDGINGNAGNGRHFDLAESPHRQKVFYPFRKFLAPQDQVFPFLQLAPGFLRPVFSCRNLSSLSLFKRGSNGSRD